MNTVNTAKIVATGPSRELAKQLPGNKHLPEFEVVPELARYLRIEGRQNRLSKLTQEILHNRNQALKTDELR